MSRTSLRRMSSARRLGALSVATVLVLVPTACSDDSTDGSARGTTAGADGAIGTSGPEPGGEPGELQELEAGEFYSSVLGALEEAGTAGFTVTTSNGGEQAADMTMAGEMRYDEQGIDLQASSPEGAAGEFAMKFIDGVLYLQGAGLDLGDASWLKIDTTEKSQAGSIFGLVARSADPETLFAVMEDPDEFELVGTEEVDGVPTHHYEIGVAAEKFAEVMELPPMLTQYLPPVIRTEMWVDADNLPRKFHQEFETDLPGGGTASSVTEGTYSDFGTGVEIEPPADSDVTEELKLAGMPSLGG